MSIVLEHVPSRVRLDRYETVIGLGTSLPVGLAGLIGGLAIAEHGNNPKLYNHLQQQEDHLQDQLSTLQAFDESPVLRSVGANPTKITAAESTLKHQITSIQARKPEQTSANTEIAFIGAGYGGGVVLGFGAAIAVLRGKAHFERKRRVQKAHLTTTFDNLANVLVTSDRYSK